MLVHLAAHPGCLLSALFWALSVLVVCGAAYIKVSSFADEIAVLKAYLEEVQQDKRDLEVALYLFECKCVEDALVEEEDDADTSI